MILFFPYTCGGDANNGKKTGGYAFPGFIG
jgi:hypothetical protein